MKTTRAGLILISTILLLAPVTAGEYHGGAQSVCSDCHITHGSKDGQEYVVVETLLKHPGGEVGLCMSCHDGTDTKAPDIVSSGTSVSPGSTVNTAYTSKYGSSAGFFQSDYSAAANPFGHDLNAPGTVTAPLSSTYTKSGGMRCSDCHDPHGNANYRNLKSDPNPNHPGTTQILIGTHVRETLVVNVDAPNPAQAYDSGNVGWFTANNVTQWCSDCHDQLSTTPTGSSPAHFQGHPSNVAINMAGGHTDLANWTAGTLGTATGFGTDIGDSSAGIPRLRFGSATGNPNTGAAGDTVTCLTCHKAHGSKNRSALVWPYREAGADQLAGCQQCHANGGIYSSTKHGDPNTGIYRDTTLPRGNCAQCHSQHSASQGNDFGLFSANYGSQKNALCFTCHSGASASGVFQGQSTYSGSIHSLSGSCYWPTRPASDAGNCANCHNPHGSKDAAGLIPSLTVAREETLCVTCHGLSGPALKNIGSQINKSYDHTIDGTASANRHSAAEAMSAASYSGTKRHVECADCHNVHKIPTTTTHTTGTNTASDALKGVSWLETSYTLTPWVAPSFIARAGDYSAGIRYEYELCFKCHSSWAYGGSLPTAPSGGVETDQSIEFNPNNQSYHPVVSPVKNNSYTRPSAANGNRETMVGEWAIGTGHKTMHCSDCHTSDVSGDPKGPHGSTKPYVLIASTSASDNTLCLKCHSQTVYAPSSNPGTTETGSRFDLQTSGSSSANHYNHVMSRGVKCRQCHGGRRTMGGGTLESGSIHGTNAAPGFMNGTSIRSYSPGSCYPTCHSQKTYTAGPE